MLKTLLRNLLDSFINNTETRQSVCHQAFPSNTLTQISTIASVDSWESFFTYTPTADGWIVISANSTVETTAFTVYSGALSQSLFLVWIGAGGSSSVPVQKGVSFSIQGGNLSNITVKFCPANAYSS